jgi:hypothetical protein
MAFIEEDIQKLIKKEKNKEKLANNLKNNPIYFTVED